MNKKIIMAVLLIATVFQIKSYNETIDKGISFMLGLNAGTALGVGAWKLGEYASTAPQLPAEEIAQIAVAAEQLVSPVVMPVSGETFLYPVFNYLNNIDYKGIVDKMSEFVQAPENKEPIIRMAVGTAMVVAWFGLIIYADSFDKKSRAANHDNRRTNRVDRRSGNSYENHSLPVDPHVPYVGPVETHATPTTLEVYEPGVVDKNCNPDTVEVIDGICVSTWHAPK